MEVAMATHVSGFQKMHIDEITQRAGNFYNLKQKKEQAKARIMQNLQWEFECAPAMLKELGKKVDEIVDSVYAT